MKTRRLLREIGCSYYWLVGRLRSNKLTAPPKDESGDFVWGEEHIEEVRQLFEAERRRNAERQQLAVCR